NGGRPVWRTDTHAIGALPFAGLLGGQILSSGYEATEDGMPIPVFNLHDPASGDLVRSWRDDTVRAGVFDGVIAGDKALAIMVERPAAADERPRLWILET